jgi:hypothetical protein
LAETLPEALLEALSAAAALSLAVRVRTTFWLAESDAPALSLSVLNST